MTRLLPLALAACALPLGGCATTLPGSPGYSGVTPMAQSISGQLAYRERIALPPGAVATVALVNLGDEQRTPLTATRQTLDRAGPPFAFRLNVAHAAAHAEAGLGIDAMITEPGGTILFRTARPVLADLSRGDIDLGTVMLTMAAQDGGGSTATGITGREWRVDAIAGVATRVQPAPTLGFTGDGRFFGNGGCNLFSTTYTLAGSTITIAPIAASLRACDPGVMAQERAFFATLNDVTRADVTADGRLVLATRNGRQLVARR